MRVIFEAESQGNRLRLYHHGYLAIETIGPHFGFQLDRDTADELIEAIRDYVPGYRTSDSI